MRGYHTFMESNGTPLQYSCLESPMDGGTWCATWDHKESNMTEELNNK